MQEFIRAKQNEIVELCRVHRVLRLALFGSAVREDFDPERSDIDARVIFEEGLDGYVKNFNRLHDALAALFGRKVDIVSSRVIRNPYLAEAIERDQLTLYAA